MVKRAPARVGLYGDSRAHTRTLVDLQRIAHSMLRCFLSERQELAKNSMPSSFMSAAQGRQHICAINCGAIPDALFENELFGHAAGAYTDANSRSEGLIAEANGGTLFLDEVDGLTRAARSSFFFACCKRRVSSLGEAKLRRADIRVISAMNRDPQEAIEEGI